MLVIFQIRSDAAVATLAEVRAAVAELRAPLTEFPGRRGDPEITHSYAICAPDAGTAEQIALRLQGIPGVRAAYVKPVDALP